MLQQHAQLVAAAQHLAAQRQAAALALATAATDAAAKNAAYAGGGALQHHARPAHAAAASAPTDAPDAKRPRPSALEEDEPNPQYDGETMLAAAHDAAREESDSLALVFQPYTPRRVTTQSMGGPVGTRHPEMIVEAAAMTSVSPPVPTYRPKLDASLLLPPYEGATSRLSDVQYESVVYAGQAHQGSCEPVAGLVCARGFYIGDGTGVGKGRQIAGVILDNWMHGRRRAVWVSISAELLYDCRRDLKDLCDGGQEEIAVYPLHKQAYGQLDGDDDGIGDGVLFSSYSALIAANKSGERRLDQIVQWAANGEDPAMFAGVIALDECHKAKHAAMDGRMRPTKTGEAVIELQRRLPRAKLLYVSATAASEVKDLAYMERLGLWGAERDAPFPSFSDFTNEMGRGGMCAMELLAMDLKARGLLVSRMLAFSGCTYEVTTATLTPQQRWLYDTAAELWNRVLNLFDAAAARIESCGGGGGSGGASGKHVWASHQQFFRQLLNSLKATHVLRQTEEALERGYSVVLGLISTGAAHMADAEARAGGNDGGALTEAVSAPAEILRALLDKHLAVGNDAGLIARRDELLAELESLPMPSTALDIVVSHFGPDRVAEMTGRKRRLLLLPDGSVRAESRTKPNVPAEQVNLHERSAFMRGEKRIAVISEAASAGISLHADTAFANTQPRMHITMELAWSAEKQLQQFGRTHRARQAQPPHYKLLVSDVGGEARFASTIAKRLAVLGAITRGDRRGASGASFAQFDYDSSHGKKALEFLTAAIDEAATEHRIWERFRAFFEARAAAAAAGVSAADQQAAGTAAAAAAGPAGARAGAAGGEARAMPARTVLPLRFLCRLALARSVHPMNGAMRASLSETDTQHLGQMRAWADKQRQTSAQTRRISLIRLVPPPTAGTATITQRFFDDAMPWLVQMRLVDPATGAAPDGPERRNVPKFLNRMLGLPVGAQRELLDAYAMLLSALRGYERVRGAFEEGPRNLAAERIRHRNGHEGEAIYTDRSSGAPTVLYELECDTGVCWSSALGTFNALHAAEQQATAADTPVAPKPAPVAGKRAPLPFGFYKQRRTGRIALAVPIGAPIAAVSSSKARRGARAYKLTRPWHQARKSAGQLASEHADGGGGGGAHAARRGGGQAAHVHTNELHDKWLGVSINEAAALWQSEHSAHAADREEVVWLLSGALMPIYSAVQRALDANPQQQPQQHGALGGGADARKAAASAEGGLRVRRALVGSNADGLATHSIVGIQLSHRAKEVLLAALRARAQPPPPAAAPALGAGGLVWSQMLGRPVPALGFGLPPGAHALPPAALAALAAAQQRSAPAAVLAEQLLRAHAAAAAAAQHALRPVDGGGDFSQREDDEEDEYGAPEPGYRAGDAHAQMAELKRMLSHSALPQLAHAPFGVGGLGGMPLSRGPSYGCGAAGPLGVGWSTSMAPHAPQIFYPAALAGARLEPPRAQAAAAAAQMAAPQLVPVVLSALDDDDDDDDDGLFDMVG